METRPPWLQIDPALERIGRGSINQRQEKYRSYVEQQIREGLPPSPWEQLVERTILGAERFVRKLRPRLPAKARDVTALKRLGTRQVGHPSEKGLQGLHFGFSEGIREKKGYRKGYM